MSAEREAIDGEIARRLKRSGLRATSARRAVIEALRKATAPLSIQELHTVVGPSVPVSSLYRGVGELVSARIISRLEFAEGFARFELDDALGAHHHHVVCNDCGSVLDLELHDLEEAIAETARSISGRVGFEVSSHRLDFFGICAGCQARN